MIPHQASKQLRVVGLALHRSSLDPDGRDAIADAKAKLALRNHATKDLTALRMHRQVPVSWSNLPDAPITFHTHKKKVKDWPHVHVRYAKANLNPPTVNLPVIKATETV